MRNKVSLIVQDGAMIPQTEVPPLPVDFRYTQHVIEAVPTTVRFLRSGCPAVQWVITADLLHPSDKEKRKILDTLQDALSNLQRAGENFRLQAPISDWKPGAVFVFSRTMVPELVETTFGRLRRGDEFFTTTHPPDKSIRWMKMEFGVSSRPAGVSLTGDTRGTWSHFGDSHPVLRIVT